MALPVQGLSGLSPKLHHQCRYKDMDIITQAASVQAGQRERERVLHSVCTEGKRPFVLLAVIRHRNASPPADYIFNQLQPQVKKALSTASQDTSRDDSPLQSAFVRLCASFKKLSAYAESIFAYTETVAALLDLKTMQLHTVSFGSGSMAPYVVRSDGLEIEPEQRRSHYCDNHTVADCTYEGFSGQSFVLIGSSGLWKYTHPRKAALHTVAFSAATHLSTAAHQHDSASAIVRSALREVTTRCEASASARLSCLNTLSQLDRLRPGSRSELLDTSGIAPRMRGDVHPDLTAATLSFTEHSPPPVRLRRPQSVGSFTSRMFRLGSFGEMASLGGSPRCSASTASPTARSTNAQSPLSLTRPYSDDVAMPDTQAVRKQQKHGRREGGACRHGHAAEPALLVRSQPGSPLSSCVDMCGVAGEHAPHESRRWALVRTYVSLLTREKRLRRQAWREVSGAVLRRTVSCAAMRDGHSDAAVTPSTSAASLHALSNSEWEESNTSVAEMQAAGECC